MTDKVQLKTSELLGHTGEEILFSLLNTASEMSLSYACWRLPKSTEFTILIDFLERPVKQKPQLERSAQGFLIQSFLQNNAEETIFLRADLVYSTSGKNISVNSDSIEAVLKEKFFNNFHENLKSGNHTTKLPVFDKQSSSKNTINHYTELVQVGKKAILDNKFKKVVLARSKELNITSELNISAILQKVAAEYSSALVSLIHTKETGTWMTATPEILASIDKD
ncbi:MAG TPA: chorismate-binding protein, partial [Cytophagaceae bacterium]|nr:chorismate-binding protein [Cytophagaceae bacterium]